MKKIISLIGIPLTFPFTITWKRSEDARSVLERYSPNPGSSCIRKNELAQPEYDLEIIVPCYNMEQYVTECIQSVLNQKCTYKIHCTIIDDGSTDRTGEIIDQFQTDERVTVIHQTNAGFSGARNAGLGHIQSKYITFLDSDDLLFDGSLEQMCRFAISHNADILQGSFINFSHSRQEKKTVSTGKIRKADLYGFPWGKLIMAPLFAEVIFPEGFWFEDSLMRQIIYDLCDQDRIFGLDVPFYKYRRNANGISRTSRNNKRSLDSLWVTLSLYRDRQALGITTDQDYYEYMLRMVARTYKRIVKQPKEIKEAFFILYSDFMTEHFKDFTSSRYKLFERAIREKRYCLFKILSLTNR